MTIQKKDRFHSIANGKTYEVAGRWGDSIILSPANLEDESCLLYTPGEIEELLQKGELKKEGGNQL